MQNNYITFDHVTFSYGTQTVLKKISLNLGKGSTYALIGKSGTGKSTLLNLLAGFIKPEGGNISVNGEEIRAPRKDISFLFQDLGLFPWQTVFEAVSMPLKLLGRGEQAKLYVTGILKEMKLENHMDKYPHELSGGERQRTALARTLIAEPELLLMDEPTSALDAMTKEELQGLIIRELKKRRTTLIFVTHDIEEAILMGETILIMGENGAITQIENPYASIENAKEQLDFYEACINLRKQLNVGDQRGKEETL